MRLSTLSLNQRGSMETILSRAVIVKVLGRVVWSLLSLARIVILHFGSQN
jgi:hypothetical protein